MINFPDNPQVEDTFSSGDRSWKWNGVAWLALPSDITLAQVASSGVYSDLFNIPTTFPPDTHTHSISEVDGLQAALDSAGNATAPSDTYSEPTYSNGVLTAITTWNSNIKAVLVQTKNFTYTAGKLTQIVVKDGNNATTLTKTISYTGDTLANITEDYA
jgi:hypothetical protein